MPVHHEEEKVRAIERVKQEEAEQIDEIESGVTGRGEELAATMHESDLARQQELAELETTRLNAVNEVMASGLELSEANAKVEEILLEERSPLGDMGT